MELSDIEISKILECIQCRIEVISDADIPENYKNPKIKNLSNLWQKIYMLL